MMANVCASALRRSSALLLGGTRSVAIEAKLASMGAKIPTLNPPKGNYVYDYHTAPKLLKAPAPLLV